MAIVDFSIVPVGTKSPSVSEYVRECIKLIKASGLPYHIGPMGTSVEGDLSEIFKLIIRVHEEQKKLGVPRILTTIKIDDRFDKHQTMQDKIDKVK
ncbi:MAG: MTH1187 family thiamine-binding protein [candidate division WOR-3 bacterium]